MRFAGQSICGMKHKERHQKGQDSCRIKCHKDYAFAVVSDGMGSKPHSRFGSRKICKIAAKHAKNLVDGRYDLEEYVSVIQQEWLKKTARRNPSDCDCTCLFALVTKTKCFFGQVGDGILAIVLDGKVMVLSEKDDDFINETRSLSKTTRKAWTLRQGDLTKKNLIYILMATDGISNDLVRDALGRFMEELSKEVFVLPSYRQNAHIGKLLHSMPNTNNKDDKTLVIGGVQP